MRRILLTVSALAAAVVVNTAAQAADVAAPATYDWAGFYVGVNAGVAWNDTTVDSVLTRYNDEVEATAHKLEGDQTAFTAGGILGYNYQIDQVVLGIETDFNYLGFSNDEEVNRSVVDPESNTWNSTNKLSFEADWFGTIRARLGYAVDNVLIYGTGGAAYGHLKADHDRYATDGTRSVEMDGSVDTVNWGWTIGGGIEYGMERWTLGAEYLYVDLGSADWDTDNTFRDGPDRAYIDAEGTVDWQFSVVRATAKLRF